MQVNGRCHCGQVSYEAELDPGNVAICHCTDCQMMSGSPYRVSVRVPASAFRLLTGHLKSYVKTAESGRKRVHSFCPECGTPVHAADPVDPQTYTLRVGCLDKRAELPPQRQIWCRSAVPWSRDLGGISSLDRQ